MLKPGVCTLAAEPMAPTVMSTSVVTKMRLRPVQRPSADVLVRVRTAYRVGGRGGTRARTDKVGEEAKGELPNDGAPQRHGRDEREVVRPRRVHVLQQLLDCVVF